MRVAAGRDRFTGQSAESGPHLRFLEAPHVPDSQRGDLAGFGKLAQIRPRKIQGCRQGVQRGVFV